MAELTYKRQTHVYELEGGVKIELRMSPIDGTVTIGFAARDDFSPYLFLKYDEFHIAHLGFDTTADNASVADKGLRHKISAGEENHQYLPDSLQEKMYQDAADAWNTRACLTDARLVEARVWLKWALRVMEMYEEQLIKLGVPKKVVYSAIHLKACNQARQAAEGEVV